jgi:hypothetical protein
MINPQRIINQNLWIINKHILQIPTRNVFKDDIIRTDDKLFTIGTFFISFLSIHVFTLEINCWPKQYPLQMLP